LVRGQPFIHAYMKDMRDLYAGIGRRIREARHTKVWTIQRLAEAGDIDPSFMGQIERGVGVPSLHTLARVAHALDIRLKDLFDFEDSRPPSDFFVREAAALMTRRPKRDRERAVKILRELFRPLPRSG